MRRECAIICGGELGDTALYLDVLGDSQTIICADGGYDNAIKLGVTPQLIIGDLDSLQVTVPSGVEVIPYPPEKDYTDSHLAVLYALDKGYTHITLCCALGGRFDHTVANVNLLRLIKSKGVEGCITDGKNHITLARGENRINGQGVKYISIIPLEQSIISIQNLKYPLEGRRVSAWETLCVSNEFTGKDAVINLSDLCLVILVRE